MIIPLTIQLGFASKWQVKHPGMISSTLAEDGSCGRISVTIMMMMITRCVSHLAYEKEHWMISYVRKLQIRNRQDMSLMRLTLVTCV